MGSNRLGLDHEETSMDDNNPGQRRWWLALVAVKGEKNKQILNKLQKLPMGSVDK